MYNQTASWRQKMALYQNDAVSVNIGERLRELREARNISMRALAARSGLSANALSMIERNKASPSAMELALLNDELRVAEEDTRRAVRRMQRLHSVTGALAGAVDFQAVANVFLSSGLEAAGA